MILMKFMADKKIESMSWAFLSSGGVIFFCLVSRGTRLCLKLLFAVGVKNAYACNRGNICVCKMHSFALCMLEQSFPTEMIICLPSEMNFTNQSLDDAHICVTVK